MHHRVWKSRARAAAGENSLRARRCCYEVSSTGGRKMVVFSPKSCTRGTSFFIRNWKKHFSIEKSKKKFLFHLSLFLHLENSLHPVFLLDWRKHATIHVFYATLYVLCVYLMCTVLWEIPNIWACGSNPSIVSGEKEAVAAAETLGAALGSSCRTGFLPM